MKKKLNLVLFAAFWSLVLALAMTLLGFLHQGLVDPSEGGGVVWSRVAFLFLGWFGFSMIVMLIAALFYVGSLRWRGRDKR